MSHTRNAVLLKTRENFTKSMTLAAALHTDFVAANRATSLRECRNEELCPCAAMRDGH